MSAVSRHYWLVTTWVIADHGNRGCIVTFADQQSHIPVQAIIMFSVIRINIEQQNCFNLVIQLEKGKVTIPNPDSEVKYL